MSNGAPGPGTAALVAAGVPVTGGGGALAVGATAGGAAAERIAPRVPAAGRRKKASTAISATAVTAPMIPSPAAGPHS
jgi:hypothetical protein